MIKWSAITIRYARIYTPETVDYNGVALKWPRFETMLYEADNPDRTDIDWQQPLRAGRNGAYKVFRASVAPRVTLVDRDYDHLIRIHDEFRVRNIPLDSLFKGVKCDIIVNQYDRNDETLLQLGELVFQSANSLNINGE